MEGKWTTTLVFGELLVGFFVYLVLIFFSVYY